MKISIKIQTSSGLTGKHVPLKTHITKTSEILPITSKSANKTNFVLGPLRPLYPNPEEKEEVYTSPGIFTGFN